MSPIRNPTLPERKPKDETLFDILKKLLPKSEHWILETIVIAGCSEDYISSYRITQKLNRTGLKTSISSVHPFLDRMVECGICERPSVSRELNRKFVKGAPSGKALCEILKTKVSSAPVDSR
jgi:hypothetical protein